MVRIQTSSTIVVSIIAVCFSLFLHTADPPRVTVHPKGIKDAVPGQSVTFTVQATGTEPLKYQWRWKLVGSGDESEKEWQWCNMKRSDSPTLTISSVQKSNEGSYHCFVKNFAGSQISEAAILRVGKNPISTTPACVNNCSYTLLCLQLNLPATWMEDKLPNQQSLVLVRFQTPTILA